MARGVGLSELVNELLEKDIELIRQRGSHPAQFTFAH